MQVITCIFMLFDFNCSCKEALLHLLCSSNYLSHLLIQLYLNGTQKHMITYTISRLYCQTALLYSTSEYVLPIKVKSMPARDEMCRAYSLYMLLDIMMKLHVLPVPPSNNLGGKLSCAPALQLKCLAYYFV